MLLLLTLLALGAIVALHELGHLAVARACRMRVDRYSIGFGPVLLSYRKGETEYALSLLPFGGYVKIAGMNPEDGTAPDDPRSYANRPAWQRFSVLAAGPFTNYLLAFVLLAGLNLFGWPQAVKTPTIGEVLPHSPAAAAGLRRDDTFVSIGGVPVSSFSDVVAQIQATHGQPTPVVVARAGRQVNLEVTPHAAGKTWRIEVGPKTTLLRFGLGRSLYRAGRDTVRSNATIVMGLVGWIRGTGTMEMGGTLAAVGATVRAAELGTAIFLLQVAGLSVAVGLFNLFPVPALDGGRLLFVVIEMVRRRPVNPRLETLIHAAGFLALIGLLIFLTVGDVRKRLPQMGFFSAHPAAPGQPDAGLGR